eukprot:Nk52_evm1s275 gene=Nk52_evmTU1s275
MSRFVNSKSIALDPWRALLYYPIVHTVPHLKHLVDVHANTRKRHNANVYRSTVQLERVAPRSFAQLSPLQKSFARMNIVEPEVLYSLCSFRFFSVAHIGRKKIARTQEYDATLKSTRNDFVCFYSDCLSQVWSPDMDACVRNSWTESRVSYGRVLSFVEVQLDGNRLGNDFGTQCFAIVCPIDVLFTDELSGLQVAALSSNECAMAENVWFENFNGFTTCLRNEIPPASIISLLVHLCDKKGTAPDVPVIAVPVNAILPRNVIPYPMHTFNDFQDLRRLMNEPPLAHLRDDLHSKGFDIETLSKCLYYLGIFY